MEKAYQLLCTYLKGKYFISTCYRQASTVETIWYYETIVWTWDSEKKERGEMIDMLDSGWGEELALKNHNTIVQELLKQEGTI